MNSPPPFGEGAERDTHRSARSGEILENLRGQVRALDRVPAISVENYMRAHTEFEGASTQQGQIRDLLDRRLRDLARANRDDEPIRVVSVGAGSGLLDVPLLESVASEIDVEYTVVEPIEDQCDRFRRRFRDAGLACEVELDVIHDTLEGALEVGAVRAGSFDLVFAVHSLYYMTDICPAIDRILGLCAVSGRCVLVSAPIGAMNDLANVFWSSSDGEAVWFERDIEACLVSAGVDFDRVRIDAELTIDRARLEGNSTCPDQGAIIDFLLHAAFDALPRSAKALVGEYLAEVADADQRTLSVAHPATVFEVGAARAIRGECG